MRQGSSSEIASCSGLPSVQRFVSELLPSRECRYLTIYDSEQTSRLAGNCSSIDEGGSAVNDVVSGQVWLRSPNYPPCRS